MQCSQYLALIRYLCSHRCCTAGSGSSKYAVITLSSCFLLSFGLGARLMMVVFQSDSMRHSRGERACEKASQKNTKDTTSVQQYIAPEARGLDTSLACIVASSCALPCTSRSAAIITSEAGKRLPDHLKKKSISTKNKIPVNGCMVVTARMFLERSGETEMLSLPCMCRSRFLLFQLP